MSPDNQPLNNLESVRGPEAAITREAKIEQLKEKIAAAERGFNLALRMDPPDQDRAMDLNNKRQEFEATLRQLEAETGESIDLDFTEKATPEAVHPEILAAKKFDDKGDFIHGISDRASDYK